MVQTLYGGEQARAVIQVLFRDPARRRVAAVAYVGRNAAKLIPVLPGLEVLCSPSPGATSAEGIRALMSAGAHVFFVDGLHSKLHWTEGVGAVIGSANLSDQGLRAGGNHELAVFVEAAELDIGLFLSQLKPRPVTEEELLELERLSNIVDARVHVETGAEAHDDDDVGLADWLKAPMRARWKIAAVDEEQPAPSDETLDEIQRLFSVDAVQTFCDTQHDAIQKGEWLLAFRWSEARARPVLSSMEWIFAEHVARQTSADGDDQVVQVHPIEVLGVSPPFSLTEDAKRTIADAVRAIGLEQAIDESHKPSRALIRLLA